MKNYFSRKKGRLYFLHCINSVQIMRIGTLLYSEKNLKNYTLLKYCFRIGRNSKIGEWLMVQLTNALACERRWREFVSSAGFESSITTKAISSAYCNDSSQIIVRFFVTRECLPFFIIKKAYDGNEIIKIRYKQ